MSWFPNFLNPWTAAIAAAIAIPALLVLYFLKLRRREMPISSTLLWKKAIQDLQVNAPFQRLRRNLLLFLQLLLLVLLCLALSRPISHYRPGAGKLSVILIDRSASMAARDGDAQGHSRLDVAKQRAGELVGTMSRDAAAMVIAFDDQPEMMQSFTQDANMLRGAIDRIQQTDCPTRLSAAYKMAEAPATFNEAQLRANVRPDVFLYSDGRAADAAELQLRGDLHFDQIGSDQTANVGIVSLSAKRNYERPTEVQIFARLANYGPEPAKPMVQLSVDGQVAKIASVVLVPDRWTEKDRQKAEQQGLIARDSVEFTIELTTGAVIQVEQLQKDALAADDAAYVVVPPPRSLRVLLVTDGNYVLEKALHSLPLRDPRTLTPAGYEAAFEDPASSPAQFDVILFDRYQPRQLPSAGSFVYFGAVPAGQKLSVVREADRDVTLKDVSVLDWRRDHPMLRYLSLAHVYAATALKLQVPPEAEVLVDGDKGPLVVLFREGRRTHVVIAFDVIQSTWPLLPSYPIFMAQMMRYLSLGSDMNVRESYRPGDTPRIPRANLQRASEDLKRIELNGPMGKINVPVEGMGDFALPALDKVGIYTTEPPIEKFEKIAVNLLDGRESDLRPTAQAPGGVGNIVLRQGQGARLELWWWIIACAVVPLLLIEWWVYTRRVHL